MQVTHTRARDIALRAAPSVLAWLISRAFIVALYATREHSVVGDVHYYDSSLAHLGRVGIEHTLPEYPLPAVALLWIPYEFTDAVGLSDRYTWACGILVLALDAIFTGLLIARRVSTSPPEPRGGRWGRLEWSLPEAMWTLALPAIGATVLARFDLVPGVLVAIALLLAIQRPRLAGMAAAFATAVKYWPALVIPGLLSPKSVRKPILLGGAVTGALILIGCLAWGGPHRLITPLTYQDTRGLQIESIPATPVMIAWGMAQGTPWRTFYASSKSYEIRGPGVQAMEHVSTVVTVLLVVLLLWLWWRAITNLTSADAAEESGVPAQLVWVTLTSILMFIVSGKVFSPQYLLWVLPSAAVGLAILTMPRQRCLIRWWCLLLLIATVITQTIFPLNYGQLMRPQPGSHVMVLVLATRNLMVVTLTVIATREAFRATRLRAS